MNQKLEAVAEKKIVDRKDPYSSKTYSNYVLGVLVVVYIFNFIDRQILTILVQPIKEELQISDTEIGFLIGTAFAIFYATLGMPIARLADRKSRTVIITIALALWSGMTAVSGVVQAYWQLALARIGVAVGEAGCSPAAHSMLADIFSPAKRATALAIYAIGIPIGGMIGLIAGGYISEAYSWRTAFFLVGFPGLVLALIVFFTVKEPKRGRTEVKQVTAEDVDNPTVRQVVALLWQQKSFIHLALGAAIHAFVGYGLAAFNAAYFERAWDMSRTEIGWYLGLIGGLSGMFGILFGGAMGDYLAKNRSRRWYMWLPAIAMGISFPFYLGVYTVDSWEWVLVLLIVPSFMGNLYAGPAFGATQSLVPVKMRAIAAAVLLFIINIIGLGLGPQLVGVTSDLINVFAYSSQNDAEALRYSLLFASAFKFWAALHFYFASKTIEVDLDKVETYEKALGEGQLSALLASTKK